MKTVRKLLVSVETPCAGHPPAYVPTLLKPLAERLIRRVWNRRYTALAMRDSMSRGEAPFASQALYDVDGVLNDAKPEERTLGMECGLAWTERAELMAVYSDHGVSSGMQKAMSFAHSHGIAVQLRYILGRHKTETFFRPPPTGGEFDDFEAQS